MRLVGGTPACDLVDATAGFEGLRGEVPPGSITAVLATGRALAPAGVASGRHWPPRVRAGRMSS